MKVSFGYGDGARIVKDSDDYMDVSPKLVGRGKKKRKSKVGTLRVSLRMGKEPYEEYMARQRMMEDEEPEIIEGEATEVVEEEKKNVRGTIIHSQERTAPAVEEPEEVVEEAAIIRADDADEAKARYICYEGMVINTEDLGDPEGRGTKVISVQNQYGDAYLSRDGEPIVLNRLLGRPLTDLCILEVDAYNKLLDHINRLTDENEKLLKENVDVQDDYNHLEEEYNAVKNQYDELSADVEILKVQKEDLESKLKKTDDDLPYYIDSKGFKREKGTSKFYKEKVVEESPKYDIKSPLMSDDNPETPDEVYDAIEDRDIVEKIDVLLPADGSKPDPELVAEVTTPPVGAIAPKNNNRKTSPRYSGDADYYNTANKGGKKKKK